MIGKLPTDDEIQYLKADLDAFNTNEAIDDGEEFMDNVPYYIETILTMHKEIKRLKRCLK